MHKVEQSEYAKVALFLEDVLLLHGIRKSVAPIVFGMYAYQNKNEQVVLNAYVKSELAKQAQTTKGTVENAILQLQQVELLTRIERSTYALHPLLVKGMNGLENTGIAIKIAYTSSGRLIELEEE